MSNDAADDLQRWRSQIRAEENLQEARRLAGGATPEALAAAIRTVPIASRILVPSEMKPISLFLNGASKS
uniref:Uncharacterized protein n=1 Tax=Desertifilum tharense IPPAS B-1220 TaxID=1781255 RepID=A0ACD5GVC5_9CYAN